MTDQTLEEYRKELIKIKVKLGFEALDPSGPDREQLVLNALGMARIGMHPPRAVRTGDGPHYETRDPLADAVLAVLHR